MKDSFIVRPPLRATQWAHEKDKDQALDLGGPNEVTASQAKTAFQHTQETNNPHSVTKAQVGLGNADNTADADKPVSTAQAAAIAAAQTFATDRANHTGTQLASTISDFTAAVNALIAGKADKTTTDALQASIDAINALLASNDTALDELQEIVDFIKLNRADLDALSIASIAGLQAALDAKQDTLQMATQTEMEAGTEPALRGVSPLLVRQAINAVTGDIEAALQAINGV